MALYIGGKVINGVSVIDDDPCVREVYKLPLEDLDVTPILEKGPIVDLSTCVNDIMRHANAAICDHHLTKLHNYSTILGSTLVAKMYQSKFPAILCTRFNSASMDEIRPYRRYIPALLNPTNLEAEVVETQIKICIGEFNGKYLNHREPWRAFVRVEDVEPGNQGVNSYFYAAVPSWDPNQMIKLFIKDIPATIRSTIKPGKRLHAKVNLGAEHEDDIYFDPESWEDS